MKCNICKEVINEDGDCMCETVMYNPNTPYQTIEDKEYLEAQIT